MRARGRVFLLSITAIAMITIAPSRLPAQDRLKGDYSFLLALYHDASYSGSIESVLERAALFEFGRSGFSAAVMKGAGTIGTAREDLLSRAREEHVPYGCVIFFSVRDEFLDVRLELREFPGNILLAESSFAASMSLSLDRIIATNISALIREADVYPPAPEADGGEAGGIPKDSGEDAAAGPDEPEESVRPGGAAAPESEKPRRKIFEAMAWFGPFLPNGGSAGVIPYGLFSEATAGFRIPLRSGHLGLGVQSGFQYMPASGILTDAVIFMVPLGLDFKYVLGKDGAINLFIGGSGGAALTLIQTPVRETVINFLPYGQVNLGAQFALAPWFGLALKISYAVYFESPVPIFGFLPSGGLYFRF